MSKWGLIGILGFVFLVTLKFSYGPGYGGSIFAFLGANDNVLPKMSPSDMVTPVVTLKSEVTLSDVTNVTSVSPLMSPLIKPVGSIYYSSPKVSPPPLSSPVMTPSPGVTYSAVPSVVPTQVNSTKININTANLVELDRISEVGPVIAQRIIDYRVANGPFQKIEDIKKVQGIGDKNFENMKGEITVEP